jgi:hypothetical protein
MDFVDKLDWIFTDIVKSMVIFFPFFYFLILLLDNKESLFLISFYLISCGIWALLISSSVKFVTSKERITQIEKNIERNASKKVI